MSGVIGFERKTVGFVFQPQEAPFEAPRGLDLGPGFNPRLLGGPYSSLFSVFYFCFLKTIVKRVEFGYYKFLDALRVCIPTSILATLLSSYLQPSISIAF
jgi:hypothetical protein